MDGKPAGIISFVSLYPCALMLARRLQRSDAFWLVELKDLLLAASPQAMNHQGSHVNPAMKLGPSWPEISSKAHDFVAHVLVCCGGFFRAFRHIKWLVRL